MITVYGWMEIRATYMDEDMHPEIYEDRILETVNQLINNLKHSDVKLIKKNYKEYINLFVNENHKTEKTDEIIELFEKISIVATGSYGLLYLLDDEDKVNNDEFRVLISRKGHTEWKKDFYFSPCSKMIESNE